ENTPPPALGWDEPASEPLPSETETYTEDPAPTEYVEQSAYDDPPAEEFMPIWMTPAPPPPIEGPVIRFDNITLNFVTAYDSVSLRDSKGTFSLVANTFVGEGGSFDWTPAGLGPDSVTCNMTTYSFNVRKPELTAELVKLNYKGKTPGFIPGNFVFKSQSRKDSTLSTYPRFTSYQSDLNITGLADGNVRYRGGFSL